METKQLYKIRTSRDKIHVDTIVDSKAKDSSWLKNIYFQSENGAIKYMFDYMKNNFGMKSEPKIEKSVWCGEETGNCYRIRVLDSSVKFIVQPLTIFIGK